MTIQDCRDFAARNPVCYLATADGDQPRVRAWLFWFADPSGFYFQTLQPKDVFRQIQRNPRIELCFTNNGDFATVKTMRLTGQAEILEDTALRTKLYAEMPFLRRQGHGPQDPIHQIFRLAHGEAFFWTMADVLREKIIERILF